MEGLHLTGKQYGGVVAAAAGAFAFSEIEDFVHAGVEGGGFEGVAKFIDDGEEDVMDPRVKRAVATAIEIVVVGPDIFDGVLDPGRFVELRIGLEQFSRVFFPALVSQHIHLGDDADLLLGAGADDLFDVGQREREAVCEFRMRFELIMVVDEDKEGVDLTRAEGVMDETHEGVDAGRPGGADTKSAYG